MSGAVVNLVLQTTATPGQLQIPAGSGDAQVALSIGGLYRWITSPLTVTISGSAGTYGIYVCTSGNNSYTAHTDASPVGFTLAAVIDPAAPSGVFSFRKIAKVVFDGTYITSIQMLVGLPPNLAALLGQFLPPGLGPLPFGGVVAPAGWLICDGSSAAIATYPALYDVLGMRYLLDYQNAHSGSSPTGGQFPLPDARARLIIAPDAMGVTGGSGRVAAAPAVGVSGGEQQHMLNSAEMPNHAHTQGSHSHAVIPVDGGGGTFDTTSQARAYETGSGTGKGLQVRTDGSFATLLATDAQTPTIAATGGGAAHNNMPPFMVAGLSIIKT